MASVFKEEMEAGYVCGPSLWPSEAAFGETGRLKRALSAGQWWRTPLISAFGRQTQSSEHQENILGNTMQSVIALLNNLVAYKDSNMKLLYEQGLVGHVCSMFTETATLCLDGDNKNNTEPAATLLVSLLDILLGMLAYTASVVRQALQAQKSGSRGDTQAAEELLLLSKPLTDLISLLIPLGDEV